MNTARLRSVRGRLIPSVEAIAQGMVERAIEFMVSRLNMNALLAQADLNAALDQVDINELLVRLIFKSWQTGSTWTPGCGNGCEKPRSRTESSHQAATTPATPGAHAARDKRPQRGPPQLTLICPA